MAIEYHLYMDTSLGAHDALDLLVRSGYFKPDPYGALVGTGVRIRASSTEKLSQELTQETFEFIPTVSLLFALDKLDDWNDGMNNTIQATQLLLAEPGDAVLLFNNESTVLLRTDGRLYLNDAWDFWSIERLAQVHMPYTMKTLPSL